MWFLLLLIYASSKQLPAIQGQRLVLRNGSGPCEGKITIYKGAWGMVGTQKWNKTNENVICKSIGCGESKHSIDYYYSTKVKNEIPVWMDEVECKGNEENLWDCAFPGWGIATHKTLITKKITCSDKIDLYLESEPGYECAGAVKYNRTSTSGLTTTGYFCHSKWDKKHANSVCKHLRCGESKRLPLPGTFSKSDNNAESKRIQCSGDDTEHLWQCDLKDDVKCTEHVAVICSEHFNLRLKGERNACVGNLEVEVDDDWIPVCQSKNATQILTEFTPATICKNMGCGTPLSNDQIQCVDNQNITLNCSDQISTVLLVNGNVESKCFGSVHFNISRNKTNTMEAVCYDNWNKENANVVCKELGCGEVISFREDYQYKDGKYQKVDCKISDTSLWHCLAMHKPKKCKTAYVICSGSVDVRLSDGPGRCAGRVEIQYENTWKSVKTSNWKAENSKVMCSHLGCGYDKVPGDQFIEGKSPVMTQELTCDSTSKSISQCIKQKETKKNEKNVKNQMLVCEGHKLVFLMGNSSCSGTVGIEQNEKGYWLSNDTWHHETATVVCKQMHCGNATKAAFVNVDTAEEILNRWNHSYDCSSTEKSLFECKESSSAGKSMAYVECSGYKTVGLIPKGECWGKVEVCIEGECGGVCEDAWDEFRSNKLCEELGCGVSVGSPSDLKRQPGVTISSIHIPQNKVTNQSNMVRNDGSYCQDRPAYVFCSGSVKAMLQDNRDTCSGNLQLFYQGDWRFVCNNALKHQNVKNTICQELGCGNATDLIPFFNSPAQWTGNDVASLTCETNSLSECKVIVEKTQCERIGLRCSGWKRMMLVKGKGACEGQVVMYDSTIVAAVSSHNWTKEEAGVLCRSLGCGDYKNHSAKENPGDIEFSCKYKPNRRNNWDCEINEKPTENMMVYVECDDAFSVTQSYHCTGQVILNGMEVCADNWDEWHSKITCSDRQCGSSVQYTEVPPGQTGRGQVFVSCMGTESYLGQCKTAKGTCKKVVSVSCTDAVHINFTETCGGKIQVFHKGIREYVCPLSTLSSKEAVMLCEETKCGKAQRITQNRYYEEKLKPATLKCYDNETSLKFCLQRTECKETESAEIYCSGYTFPDSRSPNNLIIGLSLAAFALVMIIIFVLFLRQRFVNRVMSRFSKRKESAFESGDYEDVETNEMLGSMEMRDVKQHGSDIVGEKENGRRSVASSQSYDDIEEERAVTQPSTRGRDGTGSPVEEAGPAPCNEHVTYEVEEDSQESYDDILSETREEVADVHERPKPIDLEIHDDEDYLEPDG
ncbi:scavenger receptor cysteine-rich type 1 protein M160 [Esox lucius]|uniref:SRCR domain-containing protein n=1 Tax=Esox lucius TaxID=8010 RepID=A0A3P8Y4V1_ESOLU|nr:scavenger receptor cysteine-rich type 1 protein M160 [Esox lucius]XP_019906988.2 scavenger receptor cysteine-rich type 1 protein M160 [Esox lucius]